MSQTIRLLQELQRGNVLSEADKKLGELVNAIRSVGKSGTVSITFKVRSLNEGSVQVEGLVKASIPESVKPASIFFTTDQNGLSRKDPNQQELPLTSVQGGLGQEARPQNAPSAMA